MLKRCLSVNQASLFFFANRTLFAVLPKSHTSVTQDTYININCLCKILPLCLYLYFGFVSHLEYYTVSIVLCSRETLYSPMNESQSMYVFSTTAGSLIVLFLRAICRVKLGDIARYLGVSLNELQTLLSSNAVLSGKVWSYQIDTALLF